MKLLILFLVVAICSYQVTAGRNRETECSKCHDYHSCRSKTCHWHTGHCENIYDCSKFSAQKCQDKCEICDYNETDNGTCTKKDYGCTAYDKDECTDTSDYCVWTSNYSCTPLTGFNPNCSEKTGEECRASSNYCAYTGTCKFNAFPSKAWNKCKEDCLEDPYAQWKIIRPAFCVDNTKICAKYSIEECNDNLDYCVVEKIFCDDDSKLTQCSDTTGIDYKEKCVALTYGCEDLSIDDCRDNHYCKVIEEEGYCFPKQLPNCTTLSPEDCIENSHCCLEESCTNLPGIGETCPEKTPEECAASPECLLEDNGSCSDVDYNCDLGKKECKKKSNYCLWTSNIDWTCKNKVICDDYNAKQCKDHCDECNWVKDECKHHP